MLLQSARNFQPATSGVPSSAEPSLGIRSGSWYAAWALVIFESYVLVAATFLGLVHVSAASFTFKAQVGNRYTVGPRDEDLRPTGVAGRLARPQSNFMETYSFFAVLVLLVQITGTSGAWSQWGAALYLGGRILYLPLYALGVPWLRTFSWNVATLGLVLVGMQPFLP